VIVGEMRFVDEATPFTSAATTHIEGNPFEKRFPLTLSKRLASQHDWPT
jgi:hypothetical protein